MGFFPAALAEDVGLVEIYYCGARRRARLVSPIFLWSPRNVYVYLLRPFLNILTVGRLFVISGPPLCMMTRSTRDRSIATTVVYSTVVLHNSLKRWESTQS